MRTTRPEIDDAFLEAQREQRERAKAEEAIGKFLAFCFWVIVLLCVCAVVVAHLYIHGLPVKG